MRFSGLFLKTQKEFPKDETAVNARLLIKANYVSKLMAGVFSLLPLGFRVSEKIKNIIREEMNVLGAEELFLPALHPRSSWDLTGRWQELAEIMYQFKDRGGRELGLGPTHEEIIAAVAAKSISSYKDLPRFVYQIQTKFRDEPRAKSGLLRGREFTMKDLYSFHADKNSLDKFYEEVKKAYVKIFSRCGLKTIIIEASGGAFSKEFSHEFMVVSSVGEDEIIFCGLCHFAQNTEIAKARASELCPACKAGKLEKLKAIEVGNIFKLGTKFSEPLGLVYKDKNGKSYPVIMGSYGIGVERMMAAIVEISHDDDGIIWPQSVAPFDAELIDLGEKKLSGEIYKTLVKAGVDVLYDDRDDSSAGEKFKDADLLGIPWRIVVSEKTARQEKAEIKKRNEKSVKLVSLSQLVKIMTSK
ncbi:MAG: aminoacyl--tRNA ligase-related protein [Patescibacteria group bacterium]